LIEAEDITVFIDNVIIGMEIEEEYDDIIEEVLRKIVENNLFVKLKSVKSVQKFLGLVNYYRCFVKDFTRIAKPFYEMTRRNVK